MSAVSQPEIRLDRVCAIKQGRPVLTDVTLGFESGGKYSILGPSGAGKTTLLRLLNRLEDPTAGTLWFHDTPYQHLSAITLRRRVAMVFQVPIIFSGSVQDNLCTALRLQHQDNSVATTELSRLLELAGLNGIGLTRDATALSTGEKQRVCIARALMTRPEVLLLDEPTAPLDPTAARRLIESIAQLSHGSQLTVIMVSHQPELARAFGGRVILLVGGRVVEQAEAAQFFVAPTTAQGRSYLDRTLSGEAS
ncbi:MAG TPA: ATP-binding cassette domain-containing protein [Candidatus Binatia bacterium]|jgi:putative ABC transport system ATP-binding protein